MVSLNRCACSCNTIEDQSSRIFDLNETEDVSLKVFNLITELNMSKILMKHVTVDVNIMVEDVIQITSGITMNINVSVKDQ